jgi:hypothetical protein
MSSVQEVYEAIIASRSMTFDSKALALHVTHSDSAFYIKMFTNYFSLKTKA